MQGTHKTAYNSIPNMQLKHANKQIVCIVGYRGKHET